MNKLIKGDIKGNLEKVIQMLESNHQLLLNMEIYQRGKTQHECQTPGCIIGHSVRLLSIEDFQTLDPNSQNFYNKFYRKYFMLQKNYYSSVDEDFNFLFGSFQPNSISLAIERIKTYLKYNMNINKIHELGLDIIKINPR